MLKWPGFMRSGRDFRPLDCDEDQPDYAFVLPDKNDDQKVLQTG
jgi:hypothetical protein